MANVLQGRESFESSPQEPQDEGLSTKVIDEPDFEKVFKKFDINKDNSLSSTELGAYFMFNYEQLYSKKIDESFAQVSKDGVVKEADFNKKDYYVPPHADFKDIDENNDHQLDEGEVSRANILRNKFSAYNATRTAQINCDENSDFQMNKAEFKKVWEAPAHNREAGLASLKLTDMDVHVIATVYEMRDYGKSYDGSKGGL